MRFVLTVFFMCLTMVANATEQYVHRLPREKVEEILKDASRLSGRALPTTYPEIVVLPHRKFVAEICVPNEPCFVAVARPGGLILVDGSMDVNDIDDYSFYVHEGIHVLQYVDLGIHTDKDLEALSACKAISLEQEAYALQQKFLDKAGRLMRVGWMIGRMLCKDFEPSHPLTVDQK